MWHAIIALGRETWSNDVERGSHQRLGTAHTKERRRAWHDIITFGQHTRWNNIGQGMPSLPLACTKRSNDVGHGMPSSPLGSTHGRTTSGGLAIIALRQHTLSNDVERGFPLSPLDSTHGRTTSGVTCQQPLGTTHTRKNDIGRGILSSPLGSTNGRTTSGVTCHHRLWTTYTIERRRAWHAIIAFGQHTRLNDVGCGMTSPPLDKTYSRMMSDVTCHNRLWTAHSVA